MFMRMVYDEKLAQAAYLIGCQQTGEAIIVDPERDVDRYLDLARANGLKIIATAETHIHADFISGSRELAERTGARIYVSDEGDADWKYEWLDNRLSGGSYDYQLLKDGDQFSIGNIEFEAIHTPGHTPEHIVFLITDRGAGAEAPIGMASGDFVFVGDLGRPDLLESAAGQAGAMEPAARRLFKTVHRLDTIPDFVQVWPAHGAGSACGKALGAVPMSTVGYEKRFNPAIRAAANEQGFVDFILAGQPEPPLYFANMKRYNKLGPAVLGELPLPPRVRLSKLASLDPRSVAIIDTRPWSAFAAGHIAGSLWFPLDKSFNTDVGSMVRDTENVYLILDEERVEEATRDLVRIGIDRLRGWCPPEEIESADSLSTIEEVSAQEASRMVHEPGVRVLDVRRATEFAEGHIPDALNIAHTRLASRIHDVPSDAVVLVNCRSGVRSGKSTALLQRSGRKVINIKGGILAWQKAEAPVEV